MTGPLAEAPAGPRPAAGPDDALRTAVIDAAILAFRTGAFHEVTVETVAAAGGLDVEDVRAAFPDWDELIGAVIEVWNARRMAPILPVLGTFGTVAFLRGIVQANIADPSLMRLLTAMVNIAATPEHPMSGLLQQQWLRFHAVVQRSLAQDIATGREPGTMEPARGAEQLIAIYEGLQLQSMVRPGMRLLESFDRAVARLRDGWSRTYTPPVWEI